MVTEELIRKQFIHQTLRRDAAYIYETQARVVRQNFDNERARELAAFLASPQFRVSGNGLRPTYVFAIYPFLRFLDIKYSRGLAGVRKRIALYNRVVWGRLYHETINDLRYGLTKDMKDSITAKLQEINPAKL